MGRQEEQGMDAAATTTLHGSHDGSDRTVKTNRPQLDPLGIWHANYGQLDPIESNSGPAMHYLDNFGTARSNGKQLGYRNAFSRPLWNR